MTKPATKRFCLMLDLKDDPQAILEYKRYHEKVWPEVTKSIKDSGILDMEIYLHATRLVMVIETTPDFSFDAKKRADNANPKVREWEALMGRFQQELPSAKPGEKWVLMERVFKLDQ